MSKVVQYTRHCHIAHISAVNRVVCHVLCEPLLVCIALFVQKVHLSLGKMTHSQTVRKPCVSGARENMI